ncbi:HEPN domain-containing protein [Archaeoglobales archaeon]|nr:MAG: HEPN domain-containing protein [Archaeoglobales archaeon]
MHDEIEEQLSLAEECLEEAKLLLTNRFYRGAASRAYYSMFHAAKALLALKGIATKKHSGVLRMLGLEFVNKGFLEDKYIDAYKMAFDIRGGADYGENIEIGSEVAEDIIKGAEEFIGKVYELIESFKKNKFV